MLNQPQASLTPTTQRSNHQRHSCQRRKQERKWTEVAWRIPGVGKPLNHFKQIKQNISGVLPDNWLIKLDDSHQFITKTAEDPRPRKSWWRIIISSPLTSLPPKTVSRLKSLKNGPALSMLSPSSRLGQKQLICPAVSLAGHILLDVFRKTYQVLQ